MTSQNLQELFDLSSHGTDVFVGQGLSYHWGGLYGGHIVAQALRAAANTVEDGLLPHSLRAYFIRRGDNREPVRYEVDRIRNGRSFATRRVVARQSVGAILNLEASFHRSEEGADLQTVPMPPGVPLPESLPPSSWSTFFDRRMVPPAALADVPCTRAGSVAATDAGRVAAWMRASHDLGSDPLLHCCALAYLSDDLPTEAVLQSWPEGRAYHESTGQYPFNASLDHTVWFHRPVKADAWHLHDMACHGFVGGRGLALGHVFAADGTHVATLAQEALLRLPR